MSDRTERPQDDGLEDRPPHGLLMRLGWGWWMTGGVLAGLLISGIVFEYFLKYDPVRWQAWKTVEPRLAETAQATEKAKDPSTLLVNEFFDRQRSQARAFAAEILSWSGKWAYAKDLIYGGTHEQFVQECFCKHLFSSEDLRSLIEASVDRFVGEIQSQENQLLVRIQADLAGSALTKPEYLPALADPDRLRIEYQAMLEQVLPIVSRDMGVTVSREMAAFVGGEIASIIVIEIGATLATSLGVSGGILSAGAGAGIATFGIGLVAAILVDMALDWVIRQQGYDPEGEIAGKVIETLDKLESLILDGKPGAIQSYEDAKWNATWGLRPQRRELSRHIVNQFEMSGDLGLRHHLQRLNEVRARMRDEALKTLILKGAVE